MSNRKKIKPTAGSQQALTNALKKWGKCDTEHRNAILIVTDKAESGESLRVSSHYAGKPVTLADAVCLILETADDKNMVGEILKAAMHKYAMRMNERMQAEMQAGQNNEPTAEEEQPEPTTTESNE